jgi:hypothetical protein
VLAYSVARLVVITSNAIFLTFYVVPHCIENTNTIKYLIILCDCDAVAQIRFRHLGQFFMEPSDYYDAPIDKVLHFIRGVGLIKG